MSSLFEQMAIAQASETGKAIRIVAIDRARRDVSPLYQQRLRDMYGQLNLLPPARRPSTSMALHVLTGIWKRGGLAGATPDDAFGVHVGLGETMTPDGIMEGVMRVTVLVAISRPAEFIERTFQRQMQKS